MGRKRPRKLTVFGSVEGDREQVFLDFLRKVYSPEANNIALYPEHCSGGSPDRIIRAALLKCDRDRSFAWFDEDFESFQRVTSEILESLARCWCINDATKSAFFSCPMRDMQSQYNVEKRKPILIVSQPVCVESLILRTLGQTLPCQQYDPVQRENQINNLKNKLQHLIGATEEILYYEEKLPLAKLEEMRKSIPELDLLISMITK